MNGKYYEIVISTLNKSRNKSGTASNVCESGTAFSVYIER